MATRKMRAPKKSKNYSNMSFMQLCESVLGEEETTDGLDEFADEGEGEDFDDADLEGGDDLDADDFEGEGDEVTISLPREKAEELIELLQMAIDGGSLEDEGEDLGEEDFGDEEDFDDEGLEDEGDDFGDDLGYDEDEEVEEEEEDEDTFDEDEEAVIDNGAPTRKVGTPTYKNGKTVDGTILKPSGSEKASTATIDNGAPTRKVGTPAYKSGKTVDGTRIKPGKHIHEI